MGVMDDYNYQKRTDSSAKKQKQQERSQSSNYTVTKKTAAPAKKADGSILRNFLFQQDQLSRPQPPKTEIKPASDEKPAWVMVDGRLVPGEDKTPEIQQQWKQEFDQGSIDFANSLPKQYDFIGGVNSKGEPTKPVNGINNQQVLDDKVAADKAAAYKSSIESARKARMEYSRADAGKNEAMSWKDYNAMSKTDRAAVDWNGLLEQAIGKDRDLLKQYDQDKDGKLSMAEAGDKAKGLKGYDRSYANVFGSGDKEHSFAPNVVALLNKVGVTDTAANVDEYLSKQGSGYINDKDLAAGTAKTGLTLSGPGDNYTDARGARVATIVQNMKDLKNRISSGTVDIAGVKAKASLEGLDISQRAGFVDTLTNGLTAENADLQLRMSGNDPRHRLNADGGLDVTGLTGRGVRNRVNTMNQLYQMFSADSRVTPDMMLDADWLKGAMKANKLKTDEWLQFAKKRQSVSSSGGDSMDELTGRTGK